MGMYHMLRVLLIISAIACPTFALQVKNYPLLMPNVYPSRDELYLCTPIRIVPKTFYIVGFQPNASMHTVHHMIVFGCTKPGIEELYWDCGEMAVGQGEGNLKQAIPCYEGSHVMYAWARDAKTLQLPDDVGFQVGLNTEIHYIVLQVHYSKKFPAGKTDNSGLSLLYTEEPRTKLAGVVLLGTGGAIRPQSETHMETNCEIKENKTIHPFAYRTHTHSLGMLPKYTFGRVVAGYKVERDENGNDHWVLLGKRNPLTPQMFYPVFNTDPIKPGDKLAARCTMVSDRNRVTYVGPTNNDEMCNFYLMYYVDRDTPLNMKYCITRGPPYFYWNNPENDLNNIPNEEASLL